MEWTEETISRLRSLWDEGLSTAEIGRRLSVTKNAVVGKAHRLTLPARPSPIRKGGSGDPVARPRRSSPRPVRGSSPASLGMHGSTRPTLPAGASGASRGLSPHEPAGRAATMPPSPRAPEPSIRPPVLREVGPAARDRAAAPGSASASPSLRVIGNPRDASFEAPETDSAPRAVAQPAGQRRGHACCWPLGEPGTKQFRFCGGEPIPGKPYCGEHAQIAYVRLRDRRDTVA